MERALRDSRDGAPFGCGLSCPVRQEPSVGQGAVPLVDGGAMTSRTVVAVALLLVPGEAAAQRYFDFSAGAFWGGHVPDGPVGPGWIQANRFLDQWVPEGASGVDTVFEDRASDFGGDVRVTREDLHETLMGGLRSPRPRFYYQLLAGGFRIARTMTYERDTVDVEAENARCGPFGDDGGFRVVCDPPVSGGEDRLRVRAAAGASGSSSGVPTFSSSDSRTRPTRRYRPSPAGCRGRRRLPR